MLAVNIMGNSYFSHVACKGIKLWYFEVEYVATGYTSISIDHYQSTGTSDSIEIDASHDSYQIVFKLSGIQTVNFVFRGTNTSNSAIIFENSSFYQSSFHFYGNGNGIVHFIKCHFFE